MTTPVGPALCKIIQCENKDEWKHEHNIRHTASTAYTLLTKPLLYYAQKKGLVDGPEESERMRWGLRLQNEIAKGFAEDTGRTVTMPGPYDLYVHPDYDFVAATPDAIETVADKGQGALEIKNTDVEWIDEAPIYYQAQLQVQLSCLGFSFGTLAALHRGNKLIWMDILRHEEFIKRFLSKAEEMQWRLATNNPPEVGADGSDETGKAIAALFPRDTGAAVALPPEALQWADELAQFKAQKKAIEEQVGLRENLLKNAIGDATYGELADGTGFSWKLQRRVDPPREERISEFRVLRFVKGRK